MAGARYVLLGLARARAGWLGRLSDWASDPSGALEMLACGSGEELRVRLGSGRRYSAVLADARLDSLDRDLIASGLRAGCPTVVVEDRRSRRDWGSLGAQAVLLAGFGLEDLRAVLERHAAPVTGASLTGAGALGRALGWADRGARAPSGSLMVAVTGRGGTGTSTLAMATAQGLARAGWPGRQPDDGAGARGVLMADLALHADQALIHGLERHPPGLAELVEMHRSGSPRIAGDLAPDGSCRGRRDGAGPHLAGLTLAVPGRGYDLLPGLHHAWHWTALRPGAVAAALDTLAATFTAIVCDTEGELEGQAQTGSLDVEERNALARTAISRADAVVAVGLPGPQGIKGLDDLLESLLDAGVPGERVVPVVNRSSRCRLARARAASSLSGLPGAPCSRPAPLFLPDLPKREVDRPGHPLPSLLAGPLAAAVGDVLARHGRRSRLEPANVPVAPGTLGHRGA